MAGKAVRWSTADIDAYVKRRIARMADVSFDREVISVGSSMARTGSKPDPAPARSYQPEAPVAGRLYPLILLCQAHHLPLPKPEYVFHPTRGWRFDYAWPAQKIAVEIDGGAWVSGRHTRGAGFIEDQRKRNAAAVLGWRCLHYTPDRLGEAINDLKGIL